jgi:hypothetical protein
MKNNEDSRVGCTVVVLALLLLCCSGGRFILATIVWIGVGVFYGIATLIKYLF